MPGETKSHSAFVPHDIPVPIAGAGRGPLAGLTAAIKDMYDIAGARTGGGSPEWLQAHVPATMTAGAVQKLLDAGATVIGKTICDEFFYSVTGANAHYGTPINPRAPDRFPGGSSSGSAVATAAGACDFALGSDTGGSVRIPASFCGLYGIRPTHGRVDASGAMAMAPTFDVPGWFAQGPGLFHRLGAVLLQGSGVHQPVDDLIVLDDAFEQAVPAIAELIEPTLATLRNRFPKLVHATIGHGQFDTWREAFRVVQAHETWQTYGDFIDAHKPRLGPGIKERMDFAASVAKHDADIARKEQEAARAHIRTIATPGTLLLLPTAPCIAPLKSSSASDLELFRARVMRLTCIAGISGLPQITIPVGTIAGVPAGMSFIGWAGSDEVLLELAVSLGRLAGSSHRPDVQ
jgi:amidase